MRKLIFMVILFMVIINSTFAADCFKVGEWFDKSVDKEATCCEGLKETPSILIVKDSCEVMSNHFFTCLKCGDGICEKGQDMGGESFCSCPEDCKAETDIKPGLKRTYLEGPSEVEGAQEKEYIESEGSFFGNSTFKMIVILILFLIAIAVIFFIFRKQSASAGQQQGFGQKV